jgi:hypothetical protein
MEGLPEYEFNPPRIPVDANPVKVNFGMFYDFGEDAKLKEARGAITAVKIADNRSLLTVRVNEEFLEKLEPLWTALEDWLISLGQLSSMNATIEKLQEVELNKHDAFRLSAVRGWPSAKQQGTTQDKYAQQFGIEARTLRRWKKHFARNFDVGDW